MSTGQIVDAPVDQESSSVEAAKVSTETASRFTGQLWWLPYAAALAALGAFFLVKSSLTDDAYITLTYAKNLAVHGEWGIVPGAPANSATSPLNVLLLGFVTWVTGIFGAVHPVAALGVVSVFLGGVLGWSWMRLSRAFQLSGAVSILGVLVVLVNPFVLSAIGLEVLLIPAVLLLLVVFAVEGKPALFGIAAGLAILTRLDLIIFVLLIAFSSAAIRRGLVRAILATIAVAGPWYVFSWFAFGSAVPDTLVIKQLQAGLFGEWGFFTGPVMYFMGRSLVILLAFAPAVVGVLALVSWFGVRFAVRWKEFPAMGPVVALGVGGVANYGVYSLMGVGPYHWYYVTPTVALGMFGVAAIGVWLSQARNSAKLQTRPALLALGIVGLLLLGNAGVAVKQGLPWKAPIIFGNWASSTDYARVGTELGKRLNGASVSSPGEIGTLAYYCECSIVDEFSDRGRVVDKVERRIAESSAITSLALRVNYFWFDRSRRPKQLDYELLYNSGPASGPDIWQVYSTVKGVGHFTLIPARTWMLPR